MQSRAIGLFESRRIPFLAAAIAVVLALPSLWMGFFADDFMQRAVFLKPEPLAELFGDPYTDFFAFATGDPDRARVMVDKGLYPWAAHDDSVIQFWRPLTVATHALDYALWPDSAVLMHVHNLVWFFALVVLVGYYYRALIQPAVIAGLAVLLFAIDDAHAWPAAWIANRNGPIAMSLGVAALIAFHRWRSNSSRAAAIASIALYTVALFAKESAISVCAYLFAYAVFLDQGAIRSRVASLVPFAAITIAWRVYYVSQGYGAYGSGGYIDPIAAPFDYLYAVLTRGPAFIMGLWAFPPSDLYALGPSNLQWVWTAYGTVITIVMLLMVGPLLRRDAHARFWFTGMALSLLPMCASAPQDRLLMYPGLGGMALIACVLGAAKQGMFGRASKPALIGLVAIHLVLAPLFLPATILGVSALNNNMLRIIDEDLPSGPEIADQTVIVMNGANYPVGTYLFITRALDGEPTPNAFRAFGPESMTAVPITLKRTDAHTIEATPQGGYPAWIFRGADQQFAEGDSVRIEGMTITMLQHSDDGVPETVAFRFDMPLDDPAYRWFRVEGFYYVPDASPAIGETIHIDPLRGIVEE